MSKVTTKEKTSLIKSKKIGTKSKLPGADQLKKRRNTVQKSIPYVRVYDSNDGIIETFEGTFTKSYLLEDANYSNAGEDAQENVLASFEKILNSFDPEWNFQITLNNKNIDQKEFNKNVLMELRGDGFDELRDEYNEIFLSALQEGKNNLQCEKYLTVSLDASNIKDAVIKFTNFEAGVNPAFKKLSKAELKVLPINKRLEILHDIYNLGNEGALSQKKIINGVETSAFDLKTIRNQGLTTKDIIGPSYFRFESGYMEIGDKFARTFFLKNIPDKITTTLLENLTNIPTNSVLSVFYKPIPQDLAVAFASGQLTNINADVLKAQKSLAMNGGSADLIPQKLKSAQDDAALMLDELTNGNKKLFHTTVVITIFADSLEDLEYYSQQLKTRAREQICTVDTLKGRQEYGLNACLPLCVNPLNVHKVMTSYTTAAFQPYASKEFYQPGGTYFGQNAQTKNMIKYNSVISSQNQNGITFGVPGSGKSFAAKNEMMQAFLSDPHNDIFVIDPEREYVVLAKQLGGEVIRIAPGSNIHINPFDLDISKSEEDNAGEYDPLASKVDFIMSLCERMLGNYTILPGYTKSLIDTTLSRLYEPYLAHLRETGQTIDREACPTFLDFFNELKRSKEDEARQFAASIQMYCTGTLNLFSFKTNIDPNARFIVYDISDIGDNLLELGMSICLSDIWNRTIKNKGKGKRTYIYIDEIYLMLRSPNIAAYMQMIWKRARKWGGVPRGLTQNSTDLLNNDYGTALISNSDLVILLNQSPVDKPILSSLLNISPEQQEYITSAEPGSGLLYFKSSDTLLPFINRFPTQTKLYKIMSTKPKDAENVLGITI